MCEGVLVVSSAILCACVAQQAHRFGPKPAGAHALALVRYRARARALCAQVHSARVVVADRIFIRCESSRIFIHSFILMNRPRTSSEHTQQARRYRCDPQHRKPRGTRMQTARSEILSIAAATRIKQDAKSTHRKARSHEPVRMSNMSSGGGDERRRRQNTTTAATTTVTTATSATRAKTATMTTTTSVAYVIAALAILAIAITLGKSTVSHATL